jgi:hypothetical protein
MSGHMVTTSDQNVEVLGTQFSPDAAPSSANMITDLGPSQNLLTCDLTKAVWWYRPSPGEGSFDSQSLFGRSDWLEQIANPSPLGSQNDSRAKWVGKTGFYRSSGATAFVEWSSTVYSKSSEIGVSDTPTDRSDLRRLNRLSELSPAMTLSAMRRLDDSDKSSAFSLLVPHPCSCTRGRSVGAFYSVRRARRLRIASGHARHRISGFTRGRWVSGGRTSQPSVQWQKSLCVSVQPPTAPFSDLERVRSRSTRCCGSAKREVCSRRAWTANKDSLLGECPASKGNHGSLDQPGTHGGSSAKATRTRSSGLWKGTGETEARACSIHKMLRFCKAGSLFAPGPHNKDSPSGVRQQAGGPMGSWHQPGTHRVPRQRQRNDPAAVPVRRACGDQLANPTPSHAHRLDDRSKMT